MPPVAPAAAATPPPCASKGHRSMPFRGDVRSAPVPGCVDGWCALHERHGRLPLATVLEPARRAAEEGFAASPLLAMATALVADVAGADDFLPDGGLEAGARVRRPAVGQALRAIGHGGRAAFYEGPFGDALIDARRRSVRARRPRAVPGRLGHADRGRGVGPSHLDRPAALAGLPGAERRVDRRRAPRPRRPGRGRVGSPARGSGPVGGLRPSRRPARRRRWRGAPPPRAVAPAATRHRSRRSPVTRGAERTRRHDLPVRHRR